MAINQSGGLVHGELTESAIGAFYEVYNELRYGFLESVYVESLARVLRRRGHEVLREVVANVLFQGEVVGVQRLDLLVDRKLILEVKATRVLREFAHEQLLSYRRATNIEVGLLLHFGPQPKFYRTICSARRRPG